MSRGAWGNHEEHPSGRGQARHVLGPAAFCLLLALTAGVPANGEAEKNPVSPNSIAAKFAGEVAGRIKMASRHLEEISKKDDLRQLFITGDRSALDAEAKTLTTEFKGALMLRLLLPGHYDVELDADPPLGYASMDLLQKAGNSKNPLPAEVHNFGSPGAQVVIVRRVEDADHNLIGLLHLSLSPDVYLKLDGVKGMVGYLELNQDIENNSLVLGTAGDRKFRLGNPVKSDIAGTRWSINFWPLKATAKGLMGKAKLPEVEGIPFLPVIIAVLVNPGGRG